MRNDTSIKIRKNDYQKLQELRGPLPIAKAVGVLIQMAARVSRTKFLLEAESYEKHNPTDARRRKTHPV